MRVVTHDFLRSLRHDLGPAMGGPRGVEVARAASGGVLALVLIGWLAGTAGVAMVMPLGASAVLIIAVPNSPLAQPWSVVVGNSLSAVAGAVAALVWPDPLFAPALAFGLALPLMLVTRSLHPPGGAIAVTMAMLTLAAPGDAAWPPPLWPVAAQSLFLVAAGILWNRLTGRVYPFRQPQELGRHATHDPSPEQRLGLDPDRLRDLLADFRLGANIGVADLARIIAAAESGAAARRFGGLTCGAIMSRDVVTVAAADPVIRLAQLVERHGFASYPVVKDGTLVGMVTQGDLVRTVMRGGRRGVRVGDIMSTDPVVLPDDAPVARLLPLLADGGVAAVPILRDGSLAGIITRSELVALFAHELALTEAN